MSWALIGFEKHHARLVAPESLTAFQESARQRFGESGAVVTELAEIIIDRGGPMMSDRSLQTVNFDGLRLSVPTMELLGFLSLLEQAEARNGFYEIRGWVHVIALTPTQRLAVLQGWRYLDACCRPQALAETMEFEQRLKALNSDCENIQLTVPTAITPSALN